MNLDPTAKPKVKNRDRIFGVYKQTKVVFLEEKVKDDFNVFLPVKFENEKVDDDLDNLEDDLEVIERKKKEAVD